MESTYSKLVRLKKKYIKAKIIPASVGWYVDRLFNSLHNARMQSRDRLRDSMIRTKDIARDHIVRSKDLTRDHLTDARDKIRDAARHTAERHKLRLSDIPAIFRHIFELIRYSPYIITEKSDKEAVASMQHIVANSVNVQKRISKYYGRESVVVHPPVDTRAMGTASATLANPAHGGTPPQPFWLSVNRITKEKRIDMQIQAFRELPGHRLVIVGGCDTNNGSLMESLAKKLPHNVCFAGNIGEDELAQKYRTCTGFLTTSLDEDFGMTAVEAMASGKPVIAPDEGGYRETVAHGRTGALISGIDAGKIAEAVRDIEKKLQNDPLLYKDACTERAKEFDVKIFANKIRAEIDAVGLGS